ncbi:MAG: hemolysin family protein [Planctomycetota bacterium]
MPNETPEIAPDLDCSNTANRSEDPFPTRPAAGQKPPAARDETGQQPAAARSCPMTLAAAIGLQDLTALTEPAAFSPGFAALSLAAAALAGFGALAAASLMGYSPARLSHELDDTNRPDKTQRKQEIDGRDTEYLVVAVTYTAIGWVLGLWSLQHAVPPDTRPWALALFVLTMLVVAGSLPIAIAQVRAERTLLAVLPWVRSGWFVLRWPLVLPLLGITRLCLFALRLPRSAPTNSADVQKHVMAAVADSVTEDTLAHGERTWIGNIVALKDLQVSTVMTPRPDIVALPQAAPLHDAVQHALQHGFSRYPVYRERIDDIVGIFYVKDALRLLQDGASPDSNATVQTMLREALFVPETMGAAHLLRRFQADNLHMAIVLDEYGAMVGLATVEDLLEEIVGDIGDEYDSDEEAEHEPKQIHVVEAGRLVELPARTTVAEVNKLLGTELSEDGDWETVAGLVIATCNHIPTVDETVVIDNVEFRILEANDRRIVRLRVKLLSPEAAEKSS